MNASEQKKSNGKLLRCSSLLITNVSVLNLDGIENEYFLWLDGCWVGLVHL